MATCKDCLHYEACNEACKAVLDLTGFSYYDIEEMLNAIKCPNFADKSRLSNWIPVTERLPRIDQKVLIYTKTEITTCGWYTETHGLAYNKGFETENGFMWLATATHWMPLPEPPEVEHETSTD